MADETKPPTPAPGQAPRVQPPTVAPAAHGPTTATTAPAGHVAAPAPPRTFSPYLGPSEIVPGGLYRRNTKMRGDKQYGGEVVNANGVVLATFDDKALNSGNPLDGTLTDDPDATFDGVRWQKQYAKHLDDLPAADA